MKTTSIFLRNFKLVISGVILIQLMSIAIYWFLVGKPLAIKASAQIISEMSFVADNTITKRPDSLIIWRPIARLIRLQLEDKYMSPVDLFKVQENQHIIYVYQIKNTNQMTKLALYKLDFYSPQAIILSIILIITSSFFIAWLIARKITIPIHDINQYIKEITVNHNTQMPCYTNIFELDNLIQQINSMQCQINQLLHNNQLNYAGFSHDLKTPVTQLKLALELIKDDVPFNRYQQFQTSLNQLTQRIESFIIQSKSFLNEEKKKVNIIDFLHQIINKLKHHQYKNNISFSCESNDPLMIEIYINRLYRIIENIIENAITHGKGEVIINFKQLKPKQYQISISDSGNISDDVVYDLNQMYVNFWQKINTNNPNSIGTLICHQLAYQSNWQISYKKNISKGLTVELIIQ